MATEERTKQSMGELAAILYADRDFVAREGESLHDAIDRYVEARLPGTQAKMQTAAAIAQAKTELKAELDKERAERAGEKAKEIREREIARLKADPNIRLKDDEIEALNAHAVERGIGNWEDAAYSFRRVKPLPVGQPTRATRTGGIEIPGREGSGTEFDWLKPAFNAEGVYNPKAGDKLARRHALEIWQDFDADPVGAQQRWG